jgi:hypothetical protein
LLPAIEKAALEGGLLLISPYKFRIPSLGWFFASFVGAGGLWNEEGHESKGLTRKRGIGD